MTGILIKHEALRTRGFLLVIAGAAIALVAVGSLMALTGWPVLSTLGTVLGFLGALGLVPATQLAQAVDYWRTSYGRIGYCTQTLPVRGSRIFWAKLVWATVVLLLGLVVTLGLWLVVMLASAQALFGMTADALLPMVGEVLAAAFESAPWLTAVGAPALLVLLYGWNTTMLFGAASIGSERWLQRLGWGGPVLVWFVLYAVLQVVMFVLVLAIPLGLGVDDDGGFGIVSADLLGAMVDGVQLQIMPIGFVAAIVVAVPLMLWRTAHSWDHRVSLA